MNQTNYRLFNMANLKEQSFDSVGKLFELWSNVFKNEIEKDGRKLNLDHFWRSKVLAGLFDQEKAVGLHIYNPHYLFSKSLESNPYFFPLPSSSWEKIMRDGVKSLMAMEYLAVHPDYRGKWEGFRVSELLIGLGFQVLLQSPWEMAVGYARADRHVNSVSFNFGSRELERVDLYQIDCRAVLCHRSEVVSHTDPFVQRKINLLWESRETFGFATEPTNLGVAS